MRSGDSPAFQVRRMTPEDVPAAAEVSAAAFDHDITDARDERLWRGRVARAIETDPDGAFVADRDGHILAVSSAIRRDHLAVLSMLAVAPHAQGSGAGGAVLAPAMSYARGATAALIPSSDDPRALRLYAGEGFRLLPTLAANGSVDRRRIPAAHPDLHEVGRGELERLEPISRDVRGGAHTLDLEFALGRDAAIMSIADRGFVVVYETRVWLLAARDEDAAAALLWSALEIADRRASGTESAPGLAVDWITAEQQWAVRVALAAGLHLRVSRALCVRGDPGTLHPFLPSGPFG